LNLNLKLYKPFVACLNSLMNQYPEKITRINGFHEENLNYTDFIDNFIDTETVGDASIDANANSSAKDINTLLVDMRKPHLKLLSFNKIFYEITKKFGLERAKQWLIEEWKGGGYLHNSYNASFVPYCFSYDIEDVAYKGLFFVNKNKTNPPKHLTTYNDHILQFVSWASNRSSGAVGLSNYLIYSYYFWYNDVKKGFYLKDPEYYRRQSFQKVIWDLNQPFLRITECVTEDTEILTPNGFKKYDQLNMGEEVYTVKEGVLNRQNIQYLTIKDHDGEIHEYGHQLVTPNHRVVYQDEEADTGQNIKLSKELINESVIKIPVTAKNRNKISKISTNLLKFMGMVYRYGRFENNELIISGKYLDYVNTLKILHELQYNFIEYRIEYNIIEFHILEKCSQNILKQIRSFEILPEWFLNLSKTEAKILLNSFLNQETKVECKNRALADQIQVLALLSGKSCELITKKLHMNNKIYKTTWFVKIENNDYEVTKPIIKQYKGKVWCPTTEDGVVIFRRNGKLFVSGNCAFTNISIMDSNYIVELFGDKKFPNGDNIIEHVDQIIEHQKIFMEVVAEERKQSMMTFPVLSYALLFQNGKFIDEKFAKWCNKHNMQWLDSNFYNGEDVTTLSNCCFSGNTSVTYLNDKQIPTNTTFKKLYNQSLKNNDFDYLVKAKDSYQLAKIIKIPKIQMYNIEPQFFKKICVSENHIHPVYDITTKEIKEVKTVDLNKTHQLLFDIKTLNEKYTDAILLFQKIEDYYRVPIISVNKTKIPDAHMYCFTMYNQCNPYFVLKNGLYTHNCRLLSDTSKLQPFINSIGGTSLSVGSVQVNTINLRKIALETQDEDKYIEILKEKIKLCMDVLHVIRIIIKRNIEKGLLPNYSYKLIDLNKQFNTIGITAMYETIRDFGYIKTDEIGYKSYSKKGIEFASKILETINTLKDEYASKVEYSLNVECIPAEKANVALAQKDNIINNPKTKDYVYSNQWIPLIEKCTMEEKIRLGSMLDKQCGGGQISHFNIEGQFNNEEQSWKLLKQIAGSGVIYFAYNGKISVCKNEHGFHGDICPMCGGKKTDEVSRIIGYLVPRQAYSKERKKEFDNRKWFNLNDN